MDNFQGGKMVQHVGIDFMFGGAPPMVVSRRW
jgi:hypothetical protein